MSAYPSLDTRKDSLLEWLAGQAGGPVRIENLKPLAGGASQEIWGFDLFRGSDPALELIIRADAGGGTLLSSITRGDEFRLLHIAFKAGVKVPRPYWLCEDTAVLGRSFYITARMKGETIGRKIVRDQELAEARKVLASQMAEELVRIHSVTPSNTDLSFLPPLVKGQSAAEVATERLYVLMDHFTDEARPALELGLRWLKLNAPPLEQPVLVHGDFRVGNLMVDREGISAVLDWELSHLGDPHEDMAWPLVRFWRFGNSLKRLGGFGDPGAMFESYEKLTGKPVDRARVHYWEVLGNVKWAIGARQQAERHLKGPKKSLELASIGRRAPEMELEVLNLIERGPCY